MTDRHSGYIVTLDADIREDDAEAIVTALRMVRHVASVKPVVMDLTELMARERVRHDDGASGAPQWVTARTSQTHDSTTPSRQQA